MKKIKLIPSYESIMPLWVEQLAGADYDKQQEMLEHLFLPLGRMADAYQELQDLEKKDD